MIIEMKATLEGINSTYTIQKNESATEYSKSPKLNNKWKKRIFKNEHS